MARAMARLEAAAPNHGEALELPPLHRAMGEILANLLTMALQVRDAPPALRTFARTTKHMIPAMLEGMGNVPEAQVAGMLLYIRDRVNEMLSAYTGPVEEVWRELTPGSGNGDHELTSLSAIQKGTKTNGS